MRARLDEAALDDFQNHASETMEPLHSAIAFFHAFERRARDSLNFRTRRADVVSEHDDVIDADDIEQETR